MRERETSHLFIKSDDNFDVLSDNCQVIKTDFRAFRPFDEKGFWCLLPFFEALVTEKLGFSLRHARRMYECMITAKYMRVHPYTHTITHVYARVGIYRYVRLDARVCKYTQLHTHVRVSPCTNAPRIHMCTRAYIRVGTYTHAAYSMHIRMHKGTSQLLHSRHTHVHTRTYE